MAQKGRVVIPKTVREAVGLKDGDFVHFELRNGEIVVTREPPSAIDALRGLLGEAWSKNRSSVDIQRGMREEWKPRERRLT